MPVGSFNDEHPFGLYDVLGNVWEWTQDSLTLADSSAQAATPYDWCLARGGSWDNYEEWKVRASYRLPLSKEHKVATVGFRIARDAHEAEKHLARDTYDGEKRKEKDRADCSDCPKLVILLGGQFEVRAPPHETDPCEKEQRQHEITIDPFAIAQYEVTVKEWNACVKNNICERKVKTFESWINKNRPITNVSWEDAQRYVEWLSGYTGKQYRLPSGAEWEYAARGNEPTCRWWGDALGRGNANCVACGLTWKQFFDLMIVQPIYNLIVQPIALWWKQFSAPPKDEAHAPLPVDEGGAG